MFNDGGQILHPVAGVDIDRTTFVRHDFGFVNVTADDAIKSLVCGVDHDLLLVVCEVFQKALEAGFKAESRFIWRAWTEDFLSPVVEPRNTFVGPGTRVSEELNSVYGLVKKVPVNHQIALAIDGFVDELVVNHDIAQFGTNQLSEEGVMVSGSVVDRRSLLCNTKDGAHDVCVDLLPLSGGHNPSIDNVTHKVKLLALDRMKKVSNRFFLACRRPKVEVGDKHGSVAERLIHWSRKGKQSTGNEPVSLPFELRASRLMALATR